MILYYQPIALWFTQFKSSSNVCLACKPGYYGQNCGEKCSFPHYGYVCALRCNCSANDCDYASGCNQPSTLKLTSILTDKPLSTSTGIQNNQKGFYFLFSPFVSYLIYASCFYQWIICIIIIFLDWYGGYSLVSRRKMPKFFCISTLYILGLICHCFVLFWDFCFVRWFSF